MVAVADCSGWYLMCANTKDINLCILLALKRKKIHKNQKKTKFFKFLLNKDLCNLREGAFQSRSGFHSKYYEI
jgi:hypothetical protein